MTILSTKHRLATLLSWIFSLYKNSARRFSHPVPALSASKPVGSRSKKQQMLGNLYSGGDVVVVTSIIYVLSTTTRTTTLSLCVFFNRRSYGSFETTKRGLASVQWVAKQDSLFASEQTALPHNSFDFRRKWLKFIRQAHRPKSVSQVPCSFKSVVSLVVGPEENLNTLHKHASINNGYSR